MFFIEKYRKWQGTQQPPGAARERKRVAGQEKRQKKPYRCDHDGFAGAECEKRKERKYIGQAEPHPWKGERKKALDGAYR
jgi:hypothetical protein